MKSYAIVFLLLLTVFLFQSTTYSQIPPEWKYIRPTNTGLPGSYVNYVEVDQEGNIWTTAYEPFWSDGAVTMFDGEVWYNWSNFDTPLPDERVHGMDFDHNGAKWFATENGLAKFDGENWTIYNSSNTPMPSNYMRDVLVDNNNTIWVTFQEVSSVVGGVGKFDGSAWQVFTPGSSNLPTYTVGALEVDQENNIWIGTSTHGVIKHDGLNWIQYNHNNSGLPSNSIQDIKIDHRNWKWFACSGGVARLDNNGNWIVYNSQNTPMPNTNYLTSVDVRGDEIWVGSLDYFAAHFDGTSWTIHPFTNWVVDVGIDSAGNGWAAGIGFLSVFSEGAWTDYNVYNTGLPDYFISHVYADPHDNLWFSGGNGGVAKFDSRVWTCYGLLNRGHHPWPFPYTTIGSGAVVDRNGDTWIAADGTYGGVARWVVDHWEVWETANAGVPLQGIKIISADSLGNLWVGMKYLGISVYDGGNWTHYDNSNSPLISNEINCFFAEPAGPMWIGTFIGLYKFDNGAWTNYTTSNSGLPGNSINGIDKDSQGNMWIATFDGLAKFDGANWTVYDESNSGIVSENVTDVVVDTNDVVWASGHNTYNFPYYGGVSRFDGSNWTNFTPNNSPLPHLQVGRLDMDSKGNLWISAVSEAIAVYNENGVIITGLDDDTEDILTNVPSNFRLDQNYPNPFNPTTTIRFALSQPGQVSFKVYDITGRLVADLINDRKSAGEYSLTFDGSQLSSGVYFYRLQTERFSETKRMMLIK